MSKCCFIDKVKAKVNPGSDGHCKFNAVYRITQVIPVKHPADAFTDACRLHTGYILEDGVDEYTVTPIPTE